MANIIWKFFNDHQVVIYVFLTISSFGLNWIYTNIHSTQIENKLSRIESETVHTRIDGFAGSLAAFRDEAFRIEQYNRDLSRQNELLIECVKRNDCKKYPDLLKRLENQQVNIAEAYKPIRELLKETYNKEK